MPKTKRTLPIYEYSKKVNGQTRYYIRPYINGNQTTKRLDDNGNMWLGKDGYDDAIFTLKLLEKELPQVNTEITFGEIRNEYLKKIKKETKNSTYFNYLNLIENNINPYFKENKKIISFQKQDIEIWKQKIENKKYSISYMQKSYRILKSIFDIAKSYGININIISLVSNFKINDSKVITDKEKLRYIDLKTFNNFISVIDSIMWKTFFTFLYYTGCRKGEVLALTWNDIDFKNNIIEINKTLNAKIKGSFEITNTKNKNNRKIKMSKVLIEQLLKYKNYLIKHKQYNESNYVFGNERFLPPTNIDNYKNRYFKMIGIDNPITIHEFRHSHVSLLINEYLKAKQTDMTKFFVMMSERMGHTIEVMRKTYMHLFPTIQDEIVDLLDKLAV